MVTCQKFQRFIPWHLCSVRAEARGRSKGAMFTVILCGYVNAKLSPVAWRPDSRLVRQVINPHKPIAYRFPVPSRPHRSFVQKLNSSLMASDVVPFYKNPAHDVFQQVLLILTTVDVILHLYCTYLIVRVSTPPMRQYRRFMLFSAVR